MEISSAVEIENAEVFGMAPTSEADAGRVDRNIDYQKQANYSRSTATVDKIAIVSDNTVFEDSIGKFQKISEEELTSDNQLKKSKQAIIAGKLMRIRSEITQLENQLKQSAAGQQSAQDNKSEMESLQALKTQLLTIYKSDGFKSLISRHEFAP